LVDTRDEYQELFEVYWPIGVGVFLVVLVLVLYVVVRFRSDSKELPRGRDESRRGEGAYALVLACVAAALIYLTFSTMSDLESPSAQAASLEIEVTGAKWNWRFDYPEQGISEVGTDESPPTLVVPADTPVRFDLTSLDVIHSFYIPELRFKRDAFPGRTTTFTLVFSKPGFHDTGGSCAEFCGLRHAFMTFDVDVKEPPEFEAWLEERRPTGPDAAAERPG
jgi:cytochrome c oxidase subunit 2